MDKKEMYKVIDALFADQEKYGMEYAAYKYLDHFCVLKCCEFLDITGIDEIMAQIKKFVRVYKRPFAVNEIVTTAKDVQSDNSMLVEYAKYFINKDTGDTYRHNYMTVFEFNEAGKISKVSAAFDSTPFRANEKVLPGAL